MTETYVNNSLAAIERSMMLIGVITTTKILEPLINIDTNPRTRYRITTPAGPITFASKSDFTQHLRDTSMERAIEGLKELDPRTPKSGLPPFSIITSAAYKWQRERAVKVTVIGDKDGSFRKTTREAVQFHAQAKALQEKIEADATAVIEKFSTELDDLVKNLEVLQPTVGDRIMFFLFANRISRGIYKFIIDAF